MSHPNLEPEASGGNKYWIPSMNPADMARLMDQDALMTRAQGGLFPGYDFAGKRILDLGCGPGGWVLEVAAYYLEQGVKAAGIDISELMIQYASAQAASRDLENATFKVADLLQPLPFDDGSFDLINARFIGFISPQEYKRLMAECKRLLRPGGVIRLTEQEWWIFTTSAALEKMNEMICRFIHKNGSFSPTGRFLGILPMLGQLLKDASCPRVNYVPTVIDWSFGEPAYAGFVQDVRVLFKISQRGLIEAGVSSLEELDQLYDQMEADLAREGFRAILLLLTAWGEKEDNRV